MAKSEQAVLLYDAERGLIEITGSVEDDTGNASGVYRDFCEKVLFLVEFSEDDEKLTLIFENCDLSDLKVIQHTADWLNELSVYCSLFVIFRYANEEQVEVALELEDYTDVSFVYFSLN